MKKILLFAAVLLAAVQMAWAQPHTSLQPNETVYLYACADETKADVDLVTAPVKTLAGFRIEHDNGASGEEVLPGNGNLSNVSRLARVDLYFPEGGARKLVVVCPGGAYRFVSSYNEGVYTAAWLVQQGYAAAVVKYRLPLGHHEVPLEDVQNAFRYCRAHAGEWGIGTIGIIGFSAGGHLAASASNLFVDEVTRPDFSILIYPVVSLDPSITHKESRRNILGPREDLQDHYSLEKQVSAQTPPTFLALSANDKVVNPENSIRYFQALQANGVPAQMYIYPDGSHGWGFTTTAFGRDGIAPCRTEFFTALNRFLEAQ